MGQNLRVQALEDVPEIWAKPGRRIRGFGDAQRLGRLDDDVQCGHRDAPFECTEVGLDTAEPGPLLGHGLLDLCLAQAQHPPQLFERRFLVEQLADLIEANSVYAWQG